MINIEVRSEKKISLNFEDEQSFSSSYNKIRSEYHNLRIRNSFFVFCILLIIIIYFSIIFPIYLTDSNGTGITENKPPTFPLTISWTIISIAAYVTTYIIKFTLLKFTPSLKEYINGELIPLGLKMRRFNKSRVIFLAFNCIFIVFLFLFEACIDNSVTNIVLEILILLFLIATISISVISVMSLDGLIIKLKKNYQIFLYSSYKIRKGWFKEHNLIGIYIRSNRIGFKFNKDKKKKFSGISESRWLPRKKNTSISKYRLSLFLRFYEYSTPINFQRKVLNLALALQDWDRAIKFDENSKRNRK